MHTDSNSKAPSILKTVENANPTLLVDLLKNAEVSVGHLRGRLISVPGYSGHITFSKFHACIEDHYQETVKPMQDRQNKYDKDSTSNINVMPFRGKIGIPLNFVLLPYTLSVKEVADAACWAKTPYPEISEEEEQNILAMFEWREKIDAELNRLVENSQNKIEHLAAKSCSWKIVKHWDSFLNTEHACQNIHLNDKNTLTNMAETRKKRVNLQPKMKDVEETVMKCAEEILPAAALLIGDALLTYVKYRTPTQQ